MIDFLAGIIVGAVCMFGALGLLGAIIWAALKEAGRNIIGRALR